MKNVREKKLLILGANAETVPIVRKAQKMGVYVIVMDHIINSPAKMIADKYYDINGKDVESIIDVINKEQIDGVMVGVANPLVLSYVEICDRMKFPCLISKESIDFFSNKRIFKDECKKNNLPVIKEFFSCIKLEQINKKGIEYPIIVKPAVSSGGKGISYCENENDLAKAFIEAQKNSDNYEVIGEEYISSQDVVATFLCVDGETHLLTMSDRIMLKGEHALSTVTYSNIFPSVNINIFMRDYMDKYSRLFRKLSIKNGIINIQMFYRNGEFIPYDPDCIINGESASNLFKVTLGVDIIEKFINYALTGQADYLQYDKNIDSGKPCMGASVWVLLKPGIIGKIQGREEVEKKEYMIDSVWRLKEGFEVTEQMRYTEKATLARIWIMANNREEIERKTYEIRKMIKVIDIFGCNMVEI